MNTTVLLGALALVGVAGAARADVTWEHSAQVSVAGEPLVTMTLRNDWSGDNHRARLSFDATKAGAGAQGRGTIDVIERLGDDRLVFALRNPTNTGVAQYVNEPYSTLQKRLRINFFEALDPAFAAKADPVPSLTDEQRQRLGQELRAYLKPVTQAYSRQYFRALDGTRTIQGLSCRGYRYVSLSRLPKEVAGTNQWTRMAVEFWIAAPQTGDDEIGTFTTRANALKSGPQTVSMWVNEIFPILSQAMPDEQQNAIAAFIGRKGEANYGFRGTPAEFNITITPPKGAMMGLTGDIRFQAQLKRRSTDAIPDRAFAVPTSGTRVQIEPFLNIVRNGLKQGRDYIQQGLSGGL